MTPVKTSTSGCDSNHIDLVSGNNSCCTTSNLCDIGEGDCDTDSECKPGLLCGVGNCSWDERDPNDGCCMSTTVTTIMETSRNDDLDACGISTTTTSKAGKQESCYQNVYLCDAGDHGQDEAFCEVGDDMDQIRACFVNRCVPPTDKYCSAWNSIYAELTDGTSVPSWSGEGTGSIDMTIKCTFLGRKELNLSPDISKLVQTRLPEAASGTFLTDINAGLTTDVDNLHTSLLMIEHGWHPQVANLAVGLDVYTDVTFTTTNTVADEFKNALHSAWSYVGFHTEFQI